MRDRQWVEDSLLVALARKFNQNPAELGYKYGGVTVPTPQPKVPRRTMTGKTRTNRTGSAVSPRIPPPFPAFTRPLDRPTPAGDLALNREQTSPDLKYLPKYPKVRAGAPPSGQRWKERHPNG